jgi:hypothetical protein
MTQPPERPTDSGEAGTASDAGSDTGADTASGGNPPRRRRTGLVVGLSLGLVLLLLCCGVLGGCVAFGYGVFAGPRQALDDFLTVAEDRDYAQAHDRLCENLRGRVSEDTVRRWLERDGPLVDHELTGGWVQMPGDRSVAEVSVELTFDEGDVRTDNVPLVREGEEWKVCGEVG